MAKAQCYLCLAEDGDHTEECKATRAGSVPFGQGHAWRMGVWAAQQVMREAQTQVKAQILVQERGGRMAVVKDWMAEAAEEIASDVDTGPDNPCDSVSQIYAIISKHCPFKQDVAYMPVPRCETCKWWALPGLASPLGVCSYSAKPYNVVDRGITSADFGCVRWEAK